MSVCNEFGNYGSTTISARIKLGHDSTGIKGHPGPSPRWDSQPPQGLPDLSLVPKTADARIPTPQPILEAWSLRSEHAACVAPPCEQASGSLRSDSSALPTFWRGTLGDVPYDVEPDLQCGCLRKLTRTTMNGHIFSMEVPNSCSKKFIAFLEQTSSQKKTPLLVSLLSENH